MNHERHMYTHYPALCSLTGNDIFVSIFGFVLWLLAVFPGEISRNSDGLCFNKGRKHNINKKHQNKTEPL